MHAVPKYYQLLLLSTSSVDCIPPTLDFWSLMALLCLFTLICSFKCAGCCWRRPSESRHRVRAPASNRPLRWALQVPHGAQACVASGPAGPPEPQGTPRGQAQAGGAQPLPGPLPSPQGALAFFFSVVSMPASATLPCRLCMSPAV